MKKKKGTNYLKGFDPTSEERPEAPKKRPGIVNVVEPYVFKSMRDTVGLTLDPAMGALTDGDLTFVYPSNEVFEARAVTVYTAASGAGKTQAVRVTNAIIQPKQERTKRNYAKIDEYNQAMQKQKNQKTQPDPLPAEYQVIEVAPANITPAGLLKLAKAAEAAGKVRIIAVRNELSDLDRLSGGHRGAGDTLLTIGDVGQIDSYRCTESGITGSATLRMNILCNCVDDLAATWITPKDWKSGVAGRMKWIYQPRPKDENRQRGIPRQGNWDDSVLLEQLRPYQERLMSTKGKLVCKELNKLIDDLAIEMEDVVEMSDSKVLGDMSHRMLISAWLTGCLMWVSEDQVYDKRIGDWVIYSLKYQMWSVCHLFTCYFKQETPGITLTAAKKNGPSNQLTWVEHRFKYAEMSEARRLRGKDPDWQDCKSKWFRRGWIVEVAGTTDQFEKTEAYYAKHPEDKR